MVSLERVFINRKRLLFYILPHTPYSLWRWSGWRNNYVKNITTHEFVTISVLKEGGCFPLFTAWCKCIFHQCYQEEAFDIQNIFIGPISDHKLVAIFVFWIGTMTKHCQRHDGPKGWVQLTKVTCLGQITSSSTNLNQLSSSESRPSINFKISTKHHCFDLTSTSNAIVLKRWKS